MYWFYYKHVLGIVSATKNTNQSYTIQVEQIIGSFLDFYGGAQLIDNDKVLKVQNYIKKVSSNPRTLLRYAVLFALKYYLVLKKLILAILTSPLCFSLSTSKSSVFRYVFTHV